MRKTFVEYRTAFVLCSVVALGLAGGCSRDVGESPIAGLVAAYRPGQLLRWEEYERLDREFMTRWAAGRPNEEAMRRLQKAVEPEALLAALRVLRDPSHRVVYGTFTPVPAEMPEEIHSEDGLLGLRVVRQAEVEVDGKHRLLSTIASYRLGSDGRFRLLGGPDTLRVRVEIVPYEPRTDTTLVRGFAGFSWVSEVDAGGAVKSVYSIPYVSDAVLRQEKARGLHGGHHGMRFRGVTPCGFPNHCNTCHHATMRNTFSERAFEMPFARQAGPLGLLRQLRLESAAPALLESARAQLDRPRETFPAEPLVKALEQRWKALHRGSLH